MAKSVLILEDEPLIAWDIEEELTSRGWQVLDTCSSVAKAMAAVDRRAPDLAVLDINLGNETSFDLARHLDALGVVVVFLSGASGDARPDDLQTMPICPKPVDYNFLQATLLRLAARGGPPDRGRA